MVNTVSGVLSVENQILYRFCKEMLHELGLKELSAFAGLSQNQIEKVLVRSSARNNPAVLFRICAARVVFSSDIMKVECPDVKDAVEEIQRASNTRIGYLECLQSFRQALSKLMS